jgi:hypothetical protein
MVRVAAVIASLAGLASWSAERLSRDEAKAVGLCVAAYAAPRAISEACAAGQDPATCKEAETARWMATPEGLAGYPDREACTCAVKSVRDQLKGAGVKILLESPRDPFRADPNNDEGKPDPANKGKVTVLEIARDCKVPAV